MDKYKGRSLYDVMTTEGDLFLCFAEEDVDRPRPIAPPRTNPVTADLYIAGTKETVVLVPAQDMSMEQRQQESMRLTREIAACKDYGKRKELEQERRLVEGFYVSQEHEEIHAFDVLSAICNNKDKK